MEFLQVTEKPNLIKAALQIFNCVEGVFIQEDTLDVHVFVIHRDQVESPYITVSMLDVEKETKMSVPSDEEVAEGMEDAYYRGCEDEQETDSLEKALDLVIGGNQFKGETKRFIEMATQVDEAERLAGMSKYARKVYLREQAEKAEEAAEA